jgi:hypothetical protein
MDPGAYPEPLLRETNVMAPMVSGYVGSRLRIADYAFGTNVVQLAPTTNEDNKVRLMIENVAFPAPPTLTFTGTTIFFKVNQTSDDGPSGTRTPLTPEYAIVPGGRRTIDFFVNKPFIEIACTGGGGNVRAQLASRLKWEEMAYSKTDPFFAPQLWNQKFITAGVVAPSPFPQS